MILANGGIHPRTILRGRNIPFKDDPGRWSPDGRKAEELAPYVAMGIKRPWGMMQHEPDCVVFGIQARQLWRRGTAFIGEWSSSGTITGAADVRAREGIAHFDAMFDNPNSDFPAPPPGEILIHGSVGLEDVTWLYVRDKEHGQRVQAVVRTANIAYSGPSIKLNASPRIFGVR